MIDAPELSVLVPCFHEAANVELLVARLSRVFDEGRIRGEIVLVDDGSLDDTAAAIRAAERRHPGVVVGRFHARNQGIAAAWRTAVESARGELVVTIDADLQYRPEDILRLRRAYLEEGVDVVQGWRSPVGRERGRRYWLSRGLNALLNGAFHMNLKDNKSGFVLCRRELFRELLRYRGDYAYWQSFIMVAAHAKGCTYAQIETPFEPRRQGTSFLDGKAMTASMRTLVDVARARHEYAPPARPDRGVKWRVYMAAFDRVHWTITRDVERRYEELDRTQWLSATELRALQDEKLRRIVRHAYERVPYYRARMQALGLRPEDVRGQHDLHKLPLLSKADVRENLHRGLLSDDAAQREMLRVTTSGSTGEPFVCFVDRAQLELRWAATLRGQEWTGYRFGDPTVRLWHQGIGMSPRQRRLEKADALLSNRTFVPMFALDEANLARTLRTIRDARPVLLDGYAEALDLLASHVATSGAPAPRPHAILSSAQMLPDASRRRIERAFGAKVFDKYGAREFSGIAYECDAHDGHHVVGEAYVVEVLVDGRPAEPGEVGEVVVTDLTNRCMPFLRYRLGDLAEAVAPDARCACGREGPRLGAIAGRVQSIIVGTSGQYLPGTFFAHYLKDFDHAIRAFQVVQEAHGALRFLVVKAPSFSHDVLDEVLATFRRHLGHDLRLDVEFVEELALVPTGKRVASVSRLDVDFQRGAPRPVRVGGRAPAGS